MCETDYEKLLVRAEADAMRRSSLVDGTSRNYWNVTSERITPAIFGGTNSTLEKPSTSKTEDIK